MRSSPCRAPCSSGTHAARSPLPREFLAGAPSLTGSRRGARFRSALHQTAKDLGHAPRLRDAAARGEGRGGIEDLADRADSGFGEVSLKAIEQRARGGGVAVDLHPGVDERADEPRPYGALVISKVARTQVSEVLGSVVGLTRREGTESHWCRQAALDLIEDTRPPRGIEHGMTERHGEDLVRSERRVVSVLAVDDVVEIAIGFVPEATIEGGARPVRQAPIRAGRVDSSLGLEPFGEQAKRVVPEGVDFDRLAPARSHDEIAHFRVHPGERVPGCALGKKRVFGIHAYGESSPLNVTIDDMDELRQKELQRVAIPRESEGRGDGMKE